MKSQHYLILNEIVEQLVAIIARLETLLDNNPPDPDDDDPDDPEFPMRY